MKKMLVSLSLGIGVILGAMFLAPTLNVANAGTEPSPFQPEINQLGAVANILNSAEFRVGNSIAHPPDPCVPLDPCNSPDLKGAVNRLEAINDQVASADVMVGAMIDEVMGFEPSPFRVEDLLPALEVVGDAAFGIADKIGGFDPAPNVPAGYLDALGSVKGSAFHMAETVMEGMELISGGLACSAYTDWNSCTEAGCVWMDDLVGGVDEYCALPDSDD